MTKTETRNIVDEVLENNGKGTNHLEQKWFREMGLLTVRGRIHRLEQPYRKRLDEDWYFRKIIVRLNTKKPVELCLTKHGSLSEVSAYQEGDRLAALAFIESKSYRGKWYTNMRIWKDQVLVEIRKKRSY